MTDKPDQLHDPELVLEGLEVEFETHVKATSKPARHCANNAIAHVKRARRIESVDPEMAPLRGTAAEEEAAGAVFHSLRARRRIYPLAKELDAANHAQKFAFTALLDSIETFFAKLKLPEHNLTVEPVDGQDRLRLRIKAPDPRDPNGPEVWVYPVPRAGTPLLSAVRSRLAPDLLMACHPGVYRGREILCDGHAHDVRHRHRPRHRRSAANRSAIRSVQRGVIA